MLTRFLVGIHEALSHRSTNRLVVNSYLWANCSAESGVAINEYATLSCWNRRHSFERFGVARSAGAAGEDYRGNNKSSRQQYVGEFFVYHLAKNCRFGMKVNNNLL